MFYKIIIIIIFSFIFSMKLSTSSKSDAINKGLQGTSVSEGLPGTGYETGKLSKFQKGLKLLKKGIKLDKKNKSEKANKSYKKAFEYFMAEHRENSSNPDIINYLGYISEKLGDNKNAEIYYLLGLSIDPNHIELNELLFKLYVQTNRINLAKERLKVLENCNCSQYQLLKKIIVQ